MKITEHDRASGARLGRQSKGLPGGRALRAVNARQDVRRYAAEQGLAEDLAIERGLEEKAAEFATAGGELYQKP